MGSTTSFPTHLYQQAVRALRTGAAAAQPPSSPTYAGGGVPSGR